MERAPTGAGGLVLNDVRNDGMFPFLFNQVRREREAALALNNPRIPRFGIYMVSQLPLELQGDELRRQWEQHQQWEEERQMWESRSAARSQVINQLNERITRRISTVERLVERARSRQREIMYSNLAHALRTSASTVPVPAPAPALASISNLNGSPLSTLNNNSLLIRQQVLSHVSLSPSPLQSSSRLIQSTLFSITATSLQTREAVIQSVSRPNWGGLRLPADDGENAGPIEEITLDDSDTKEANEGAVIRPERNKTQKCPFCSKSLSTGHMTRHVHLHCKSARKEIKSRQD